MKTWEHPGGKLRELGAESLTDAELLSILVSTGTKGKSAEDAFVITAYFTDSIKKGDVLWKK